MGMAQRSYCPAGTVDPCRTCPMSPSRRAFTSGRTQLRFAAGRHSPPSASLPCRVSATQCRSAASRHPSCARPRASACRSAPSATLSCGNEPDRIARRVPHSGPFIDDLWAYFEISRAASAHLVPINQRRFSTKDSYSQSLILIVICSCLPSSVQTM